MVIIISEKGGQKSWNVMKLHNDNILIFIFAKCNAEKQETSSRTDTWYVPKKEIKNY
jgi:hypothetical protein